MKVLGNLLIQAMVSEQPAQSENRGLLHLWWWTWRETKPQYPTNISQDGFPKFFSLLDCFPEKSKPIYPTATMLKCLRCWFIIQQFLVTIPLLFWDDIQWNQIMPASSDALKDVKTDLMTNLLQIFHLHTLVDNGIVERYTNTAISRYCLKENNILGSVCTSIYAPKCLLLDYIYEPFISEYWNIIHANSILCL